MGQSCRKLGEGEIAKPGIQQQCTPSTERTDQQLITGASAAQGGQQGIISTAGSLFEELDVSGDMLEMIVDTSIFHSLCLGSTLSSPYLFLSNSAYILALVCSGWHRAVRQRLPNGTCTPTATVFSSSERFMWAYTGLTSQHRPPLWGEELCQRIAKAGLLQPLQWAHTQCAWDSRTSQAAAEGGHLEVLQWAKQHGCYWGASSASTCCAAARGGHLEVLQWLHENGYQWNEYTCHAAAKGGFLEVLQWARENGCQWDASTCKAAADAGHLEVLQWLHQNGCPWDKWTLHHARICRSYEAHRRVLQWARQNGCPE